MSVFRDTAVLQIKLLVDGLRDALLVPASLGAALIGLLLGGDSGDAALRRILLWGRRSERWINLFGYRRPLQKSSPAGSLDRVLDQVEDVLAEQYRKGRSAAETRAAVRKAMREEGKGD